MQNATVESLIDYSTYKHIKATAETTTKEKMLSNRTQFIMCQLTADLYSDFVHILIAKSMLLLFLPSKNYQVG